MYRVSDFLKKHDVNYKRNFKISDISSIKIGGNVDIIAYPKTESELILILDFITSLSVPYKIIGKMTNILASDDGFRGVLISTKLLTDLDFDGIVCTAGVGLPLNSLLFSAAKRELGGIEDLFGIPGTLGGLLHNNGGAGKLDLSKALLFARVYSPSQRKILILDKYDLRLGYRESILPKTDFAALSVTLAFISCGYGEVMHKIRAAAARRRAAQPLGMPSLGSIFKREGDIAVSRLIDESGLKGYRIGGAEISKRHAGFIINREKATASDVLSLIEHIKKELLKNYGFEPKEEIEFLG